jgi:p-hydroxybenzoate 3-monooxygenase
MVDVRERVQVAIVGAGPAGLLLGQLLATRGISNVIVERQSREYVEARIRAGVLEQGTVGLLRAAGVAARLDREGMIHEGLEIAVEGARNRLDFHALTGGKVVTVYGQTKVTEDLIAARLDAQLPLVFNAQDARPADVTSQAPHLSYRVGDTTFEVQCDFIAGCDGFHGVSRTCFGADTLRVFERVYPFAWLGILSDSPPPSDELIYSRHSRGFSLCSMRSPTISRHYLQCAPDDDVANWPDERVFEELGQRLSNAEGNPVQAGPVLDKSITQMRSFVAEPMSHGRLFLAGDAAHIVPPTGAKGLNLAASDVHYLFGALTQFYETGSERGLADYSERALARVWKAQRFSWWMTSLLHSSAAGAHGDALFDDRARLAELHYTLSSTAAMTAWAENYVGLPY